MVMSGNCRVAGTNRQHRLQASLLGGVEFRQHIANKQNLARCQTKRSGDGFIARRFSLGTGGCIVVATQQGQ